MSHFNNVANSWDTNEKIEQNKKYAEEIKTQCVKTNFKNILEIGCGTGLLSKGFIDDEANFLGVDTSAGMLEVFNKKFSNYPKVKSQLINLEKEEIPIDQIDLVISSMAFHHLENPFQLLKKLKSHLASNAILTFIDLDQEDGSFHPDPKNMGVHHFGFSEQEIKSWAQELGFKVYKRSTLNIVHKNNKEYPICLNIFMNS